MQDEKIRMGELGVVDFHHCSLQVVVYEFGLLFPNQLLLDSLPALQFSIYILKVRFLPTEILSVLWIPSA